MYAINKLKFSDLTEIQQKTIFDYYIKCPRQFKKEFHAAKLLILRIAYAQTDSDYCGVIIEDFLNNLMADETVAPEYKCELLCYYWHWNEIKVFRVV